MRTGAVRQPVTDDPPEQEKRALWRSREPGEGWESLKEISHLPQRCVVGMTDHHVVEHFEFEQLSRSNGRRRLKG